MATQTTNYKLTKLELTDRPDITQINQNFDTIDSKLKELETNSGGDSGSGGSGKKTVRFTIGTSTAGWTSADCDYLCDGTDDQVEINQAIQALPSTGGEIKILSGTYNIKQAIAVNKVNIKLSGNGNTTILKAISSNMKIIEILGTKCTVDSLTCDGNKVGGTGISLRSNSNTIANNFCDNNSNGIAITSGSNNIITNNSCNGNSNAGISIAGSNNNNNTIANNFCNSGGGFFYGIYVTYSKNSTITGNTCNNNGYGIYLNNTSNNNTITGNTCNDNAYGISLTDSNSNTITGNTCIRGVGQPSNYTTNQHTIYLYNAKKNTIVGNNCSGKEISVIGGSTENLIANNRTIDGSGGGSSGGGGSSTTTKKDYYIIGTSTAGWKKEDCDYLCDGTADQVEINQAIQALPSIGGEIKILAGTYNITGAIQVNKENIKISGNGNATVLKRMWNAGRSGVIEITKNNIIISNLSVDGNKTQFNEEVNGIRIDDAEKNIRIINNISNNNSGAGLFIASTSKRITATGNIFNDNGNGVVIYSSNSIITNNTCDSNKSNGIGMENAENNIVMGNICNNNVTGVRIDSSNINTITGNVCHDNSYGVFIQYSSNNTISDNIFIRGAGQSSDYTGDQYAIYLDGSPRTTKNAIVGNNCAGKAPVQSGSNNIIENNVS